MFGAELLCICRGRLLELTTPIIQNTISKLMRDACSVFGIKDNNAERYASELARIIISKGSFGALYGHGVSIYDACI